MFSFISNLHITRYIDLTSRHLHISQEDLPQDRNCSDLVRVILLSTSNYNISALG